MTANGARSAEGGRFPAAVWAKVKSFGKSARSSQLISGLKVQILLGERYDKKAQNFLAFAQVASIMVMLP